jgi:hypothetical protein
MVGVGFRSLGTIYPRYVGAGSALNGKFHNLYLEEIKKAG